MCYVCFGTFYPNSCSDVYVLVLSKKEKTGLFSNRFLAINWYNVIDSFKLARRNVVSKTLTCKKQRRYFSSLWFETLLYIRQQFIVSPTESTLVGTWHTVGRLGVGLLHLYCVYHCLGAVYVAYINNSMKFKSTLNYNCVIMNSLYWRA